MKIKMRSVIMVVLAAGGLVAASPALCVEWVAGRLMDQWSGQSPMVAIDGKTLFEALDPQGGLAVDAAGSDPATRWSAVTPVGVWDEDITTPGVYFTECRTAGCTPDKPDAEWLVFDTGYGACFVGAWNTATGHDEVFYLAATADMPAHRSVASRDGPIGYDPAANVWTNANRLRGNPGPVPVR